MQFFREIPSLGRFLRRTFLACLALAWIAPHASAANVTYSTGTLSTPGSWVGGSLPSTSDIAVLSATSAPISASIGTGLSVAGIQLTGGSNTTINGNGSNTLTLGTSGITFSVGSGLTLGAPVALSGSQAWSLGTAANTTARININSSLTTNGNALSINGAGGTGSRTLSFGAANTLGTEVTIGSAINVLYVQGSESLIVTFSGTNNSNTAFSVLQGTARVALIGNSGANSSLGTTATISIGNTSANGTLAYTGNTDSTNRTFLRNTLATNASIIGTTVGQTLTISGNLTQGTGTTTAGGWLLGGVGNLNITGTIAPTNGAGVTLTKIGSGTLTLSGSNGYTGLTTVNDGVLAFSTKNALANSSGVTISATAGNATLTYTGAADTFARNITVSSGTGTVRNTGGGLLTLTGTLSKNGTVLRFNTGTFSVGGLITGANANSDLVIDAATVTLTNSNNDYNGPTFVQNGGTLILGANNVISSTSAVTVDASTLTVGGFTDAIQSLTTAGNSTINMSVSGGVSGGLTMGNLTFGAGTDTLGLTMTSATAGRYTLLSYAGTRSGTFDTVTGLDSNYTVAYGTTTTSSVDLQRKAEQSATLTYAQPTSGTVNAFTNTNISFSGTLANLTPTGGASLAVSLSGSGGQLTVNGLAASSGATVAAASDATVTGTISTGATLGARTWSVVNTDTAAIGSTTSTATGVVNVFQHGTPTLSGTTIDFGYVLVGSATSRSLSVSNGSLGNPTANTAGITWTSGSLSSGLTGGGANSLGVIASGSGTSYSYTLATGSAGAVNGSQTFTFADDTSILGNGSLGSQTVNLTGTVLDPATANLIGGIVSGTNWSIDLGSFNQGSGSSSPLAFGITNLSQTFGLTADLFLASFTADPGNTGAISMSLTGTSAFPTLLAGGTNGYTASMSLATPGLFTNVYNLSFNSSKNGSSLGGTPQNVTLTVTGIIVVPEPGTIALAGVGIVTAGWLLRRKTRRNAASET